ncbi:MAG: hypothetical protein HY677_01475 [Chloroflexi bacterium]|nr:hypothetical protein [Chloroflexota bacterium]
MISVPAFLLRRLYVKGSLKNTANGFAFQLQNSLGSGYAKEMLPLTLNGQEIPLETASFSLDGQVTPFSEVNEEKPFTLPMNKSILIEVKGKTLEPKPHKVGMAFVVSGLGKLSFDVTDTPA